MEREKEIQKTYMELLDVGTAGLAGRDDVHAHDVDGSRTSAVASAHITVFKKRSGKAQQIIDCLESYHLLKWLKIFITHSMQ